MIGMIDYGSGNLRSVYNAFRYLGAELKICRTPEEVRSVEKLVLPGVGSGKDSMNCLDDRDLIAPIKEHIAGGKLFLGICLGLQLLFTKSEESGGCDCLDVIKGDVKLFPRAEGLKVPQIGWNTVAMKRPECPLFMGIPDNTFFYFVHSYYCVPGDNDNVAGITGYGLDYVSVLWKDNVFATQFHPERSQKYGLKMLENFIRL
ncbi:MAG: imidazole glycerol phosphate synthase subunit HisH [Candidatus Omnitrophica bacterium]|nr:imidazole glycerol phosphate synthase subunit HisH [Candidatus Omnitrophota bacterium]MDD5487473.1 imidazole glycerol phosphate synthase subunit HisH [Candidatus Omnitrophota bacterium]